MAKRNRKKIRKYENKRPAQNTKTRSNVGTVWRGNTPYIDPETKLQRNYVVVTDNGKNVTIAKLKSIKIFDENGKNADRALIEINATRYGLEQRTGVDYQMFYKNYRSGKALSVNDKAVFPEKCERFKLSSHDTHKVLKHTGRSTKRKRGK